MRFACLLRIRYDIDIEIENGKVYKIQNLHKRSFCRAKVTWIIDVKTFYVFNFFLIFLIVFFYLKKTCIENPIKNFEKQFWMHSNELKGHR